MKRTKARPRLAFPLGVVCALAAGGCMVPMRGVDFGSWIPEPSSSLPLARIHRADGAKALSPEARVLVLPLLATLPAESLDGLRHMMEEQARLYFPCRVQTADPEGVLAEYVSSANICSGDGRFNIDEIARLGRYLDASHVLAACVREARFYPPQNLEIVLVVVEAETSRPVVEMHADFPASEQQVVAALGRHLDERVARKYDRTSLDLVLRSPSEYSRFALAECCRVLAQDLWPARNLSRSGPAPTKTQMPLSDGAM